MLSKIKQIIFSNSSVYGAAILLASFTFLSQVFALVRDRLLAISFGAGPELDIYYAAFRVPDFIFTAVASLIAVSVIVPLISSLEGDKVKLKKAIDSLFSVFFVVIIVASVVAFFVMPYLNDFLFKGFWESQLEAVTTFSRILLLSPLLLGLSNFFGGIAQARMHFFAYALSPVLYNLGIILGIIFLVPIYGMSGIVIGVVLGALMHFLIQTPYLWREKLLPSFILKIDFSMVKKTLSVSIARTLALSINHITLLVLFGMATSLAMGAITIFSFASNLQAVLVSIFGASISLAAFPTMSLMHSKGNSEDFSKFLAKVLSTAMFWVMPASFLFIVLRAHIVRVILGSGYFSWDDTRLTSASLAVLSISAIFQTILLVYTRAFYATNRTKLPFVTNFISFVISISSAHLFMWINSVNPNYFGWLYRALRIEDISIAHTVLLSLAYSVGVIISGSAIVLIFESKHKVVRHAKKSIGEIFLASIVVLFVSYGALQITGDLVGLESTLKVFIQGLTAGVLGILGAIFVLYVLKNKELMEFLNSVKSKIWRRQNPVYPDTEVV